MPITFFDYETAFDEEGTMINQIIGFGPMGSGVKFYETWEFSSIETFVWTLSTISDDGSLSEMMKGDYARK